MKKHAPATQRNREPIREVLARVLPAHGLVLEIASGSGEHAVAFAGAFPQLAWQPTDRDDPSLASIEAHRAEANLPNLRAPLRFDVMAPCPIAHADAVVCINMVHIAPWEAALAMFRHAADLLDRESVLVLYGPYLIDGATAPSNLEFDRSLRARDPSWGVREVRDLEAAAVGFMLSEIIALPANNHALTFQRR